MKKNSKISTLDAQEVAQFNKISSEWWEESGSFQPLHKLNNLRIAYIEEQLRCHFYPNRKFESLKIADIGCGGGLASEPLRKIGASITAIDAGEENIKAAKKHSLSKGLDIDYRVSTVEDLADTGEKFDVVIALEILEHVANPEFFIASCCKLLNKNGVLIISTLNRTTKSFLLGVMAAEYILKWLPEGTHDWDKFLKPSEISDMLIKCGFVIKDLKGMTFKPLSQEFCLSESNFDINYILSAVHPVK